MGNEPVLDGENVEYDDVAAQYAEQVLSQIEMFNSVLWDLGERVGIIDPEAADWHGSPKEILDRVHELIEKGKYWEREGY